MTFQQLTVFLAVCEEMNYTRAAARTYMSRQAVRQNIAELERELGGALFNNYRNHLLLTAKGALLQKKAIPVVKSFEDLQKAMAADTRLSAPIRLGISNSLISDYLPDLRKHISSFMESYPNLPLTQHHLNNDTAVSELTTGNLDACLVLDLGTVRAGLERTPLTKHPSGIHMKNTIPLFSKKALTTDDLTGYQIFVPGIGEEFHPLLERASKAEFSVVPNFYQVLFFIMEHDGLALNRYNPAEETYPEVARTVPFSDMPPLYSSFLVRKGMLSSPLMLLRDWLAIRLKEDFAHNEKGVKTS